MTRAIEQLKQAMEVCELGALSLPDQIDALMDTGKAVLQEVSTLTPPNEWVSVENSLPPNKDNVIVAVEDKGERWVTTGYYFSIADLWCVMVGETKTIMDVSHWMPLPAPPDKDNHVPAKAPNEPLTVEQLRGMDGKPVWVEHNNGGEWLVIHWDYVGRITTAHKARLLDYEYGRTWLAYRHPLEGEANG